MNAVTKSEADAERVARLAASITRTAEAIERYVFDRLCAPVTVNDLIAFSRDPESLARGVDFDSIKRMRDEYDEVVRLVGEEAPVFDPTQNGLVPVVYLGQRVGQVEALSAAFAVLQPRAKR